MTENHPITPPPELVQQWWDDFNGAFYEFEAITATVFRAGADQELEACCALLGLSDSNARDFLQSARRPKPPSLKEQALEDLDSLIADLANHGMGFKATNIRRALEQLDD